MTVPRYLSSFSLDELPRQDFDVIIAGGGIAGLYTALCLSSTHHKVLIIAKHSLLDSNTRYAQGGIAAVFSDDDAPEYHLQDTLLAGAGLCDPKAVEVLVHEGPACVQDLMRLGTNFDTKQDGSIALTMEGAHSRRRILHAKGDATGSEIIRALSEQVKGDPHITVWEDHYVIDLITHEEVCLGALVLRPDGSQVLAAGKATVLCTGGAGQLYRCTTNPEAATGDGIAIAYRAGAYVRDMEFVQFHPTALSLPDAPRFLISEAVRGEGAWLRNIHGERFMARYHPMLELAPRDVVARAIISEMEATGADFVYLDITHEDPERVRARFPTIYATCLRYGLDLTKDRIPVAPAAHYMMGGIKTDLSGETNIKGLFACGEAASTGVHGANRLASNSLTEAIVFGRRIAQRISELKAAASPLTAASQEHRDPLTMPVAEKQRHLQETMLRYVGVRRHASTLKIALEELRSHQVIFSAKLRTREEYEYANLLTCALLTTEAALLREESRGGHYREDYPEQDDAWLRHLVFQREIGIVEEPIYEHA
ncbi:L-aspartate oxidase [Insulibacter thermoxylanivorax]|uniref:L-aspartate oxidase n=1 Tax=Insulibacter thermoxylanivorax TaxID=2749268 RepID=A0A916QDB3_9BACL|nr:L-aspartate oxidase [Insulibacter thermoxylanivorax]GFR38430.1 L-aspartate oxidase [Insulibacter thermoxylanivorax]